MSGKKWWQATPAVAKASLFYVRLGQKGRSRYTSVASNATGQGANTFHGENISCNEHCNAFSNELQIVLPVESAAGCLVSGLKGHLQQVRTQKICPHPSPVLVHSCLQSYSCEGKYLVRGQGSECLWGSHRLCLWAHQELFSAFPVWDRAACSPIHQSCSVLTRTTFDMKLKTSISWSFREYKPLGIKRLAQ